MLDVVCSDMELGAAAVNATPRVESDLNINSKTGAAARL
jgi:hypothetical protein